MFNTKYLVSWGIINECMCVYICCVVVTSPVLYVVVTSPVLYAALSW